MIKSIFYGIVFLLGIFLYCFLTRYQIISSERMSVVYKIDRITGKSWMHAFADLEEEKYAKEWVKIKD